MTCPQLVKRLFKRAGIKGFSGHDLRRTFATMVNFASKDELLTMRLLRDAVPGVGRRYIKVSMSQLVEALIKYSPVSQTEECATQTEESGDPKAPPAQLIDGADGGELASL